MAQTKQTIVIGQLQLHFLLDAADTNNGHVVFEFEIPEGAKVPVPHYHKDVDEIVYGLEGITSTTVDGKVTEIGPGQSIFIPRGAVHHHDNRHSGTAKSLVVLTPSSIGPVYFQEMSELIQPGVPPDPAKAAEIMLRHGLVPVTS